MITLCVGLDTKKIKSDVRGRAEGTELVVFGEGAESFERVPSYLASRGLFSEKVTLLLDRPLDDGAGKRVLEEYAHPLNTSEVAVFVVVPTLSATEKKLFPKGITEERYDAKEVKPAPRPNVFAFTNAVMRADKKNAWLGYHTLLVGGSAAEEIHGALLWAVRSALLAAKTQSPDEAGLKPFVFSKSKRFADTLGVARVEAWSRELIAAYHKARSGEGTLELNLEKFLLEKV
ncbi:MAG: hypothetical protein ACJKTH_00820 [Patescibacteria group bacterium UBA2163]